MLENKTTCNQKASTANKHLRMLNSYLHLWNTVTGFSSQIHQLLWPYFVCRKTMINREKSSETEDEKEKQNQHPLTSTTHECAHIHAQRHMNVHICMWVCTRMHKGHHARIRYKHDKFKHCELCIKQILKYFKTVSSLYNTTGKEGGKQKQKAACIFVTFKPNMTGIYCGNENSAAKLKLSLWNNLAVYILLYGLSIFKKTKQCSSELMFHVWLQSSAHNSG